MQDIDMTNADAVDQMARELAEKAKEMRAAKRKAEREAARAKERVESAAHMNRMFDEIGQPLAGLNAEQHGIVYAQAYERGHSCGFSEIEVHYGELAEMARKLIAAS